MSGDSGSPLCSSWRSFCSRSRLSTGSLTSVSSISYLRKSFLSHPAWRGCEGLLAVFACLLQLLVLLLMWCAPLDLLLKLPLKDISFSEEFEQQQRSAGCILVTLSASGSPGWWFGFISWVSSWSFQCIYSFLVKFGLFLFSLELWRFPAVFKRLVLLLILFTPGVLQGLLPGFFQFKPKAVIQCLISFMAPSGSDTKQLSFRCLFCLVKSEPGKL